MPVRCDHGERGFWRALGQVAVGRRARSCHLVGTRCSAQGPATGSGGRGSVSNSEAMTATAAMPSATEWCSFSSTPTRPPVRPVRNHSIDQRVHRLDAAQVGLDHFTA
jgi:hypothetical protein